jgi:hypothetical protein
VAVTEEGPEVLTRVAEAAEPEPRQAAPASA